ncbi:uncharacterized protein LTR77_009246 [Saxophila tyrrhenica]|uniref:Uncharacterized protein n=1 Tax=Saxophila tyrrhenica TaxID=1690608 RepID=A0AAV9NZ99_9PEZI|nr:hypothetical protein LTR77_009246 [Saxophila tyrrhenica]
MGEMGRPHSREMPDLTASQPHGKLPAELRALVDFLDTDGRPTAVWEDINGPLRICGGQKLVYENAAFKSLGLGERYIRQLVKDIEGHGKLFAGQDVRGRCEKRGQSIVDVRSWRITPVAKHWKALIYEGEVPNGSHGGSPAKSENGTNGHGYENMRHDPQDWTRFPVDGLSQWVEYVRTFDWASTAIGPMEHWSDLLRSCALHVMAHPHARLVVWGEQRTVIYNEACIPLVGQRHPACLGQPVAEAWAELWTEICPMVEQSFNGKTLKLEQLPLLTRRNGAPEETYWDAVALPVVGEGGKIFGQFLELTEMTRAVTGIRRRNMVVKIRQKINTAETLPELWSCFLNGLEEVSEDVPFALVYAASDLPAADASGVSQPDPQCSGARLAGTVGLAADHPEILESFNLVGATTPQFTLTTHCLNAWKTRKSITIKYDDGTLPDYLSAPTAGRKITDRVQTAVVSPITSLGGNDVLGVLVLGFNPRQLFNEEYRMFGSFLSDFLCQAASLISLPQEQRRAQRLADEMNTTLAQQLRLITLQAERQEAKFARMANEAPTGVFVFDPDGRLLYANDAYLRVLGETRESQASRSPHTLAWQEHIHPDDMEHFSDIWERGVQQKMPFTIEHRLKKPWIATESGQEVSGETWLLANAFPDVGPDGKITSVQGWLTDISHRKFTDGLVARKLEDALESRRQTENFIDMTSHEMRNPLSAILQSADSVVLTLEHADAHGSKAVTLPHDVVHELVDYAHTIILCAQHQKRIVDDILTLSKLDASLLEISPDRVQPPELLYKALTMFESEIKRAGITAKVDVEPTYELLNVDWVILDPSRVLQVVINLLTNAIKFTQDAATREITVCVGASYEKPTGKHHGVDFIPTKHIRRAESPLDEWGDGEILYLQFAVTDTGRGLSEEDMQVLFQRFKQASPKTYKQYGGSGLGLFISRELCELQGGQIGVSSCNGKTSFTFFVRAKKWVPDAPSEKAHRPTLPRFTSTSASPMTFNRRGSVLPRSTSAGTDELRRIPSVKEDPHTTAGAPHPLSRSSSMQVSPATETKLHVLVVEDNLINQKVMRQQLTRAGCMVHVANHGLECLTFIEKSIFCRAETHLSVVLLDLEMPTMDGITCIKHIRERQGNGEITKHVPVIAVTANARSEQISMAIEAGMDQVVTKPFRIPELLPQMHALVEEVGRRWEDG